MSKWRILTVALAVIGLAFIAVAIVYWAEPAGSLPHWVPGYVANGDFHHWKHGALSAAVGVVFFVAAWFSSAKK